MKAWVDSVIGRQLNLDGVYGTQCVDVSKSYAEWVTKVDWRTSHGYGNAYQLFDNMPDKYWTKIKNEVGNASQIPKAGDVIVWSATSRPPFGHIAVVESATQTNCVVIQQDGLIGYRDSNGNYIGTGKTYRKTQSYAGVIGWLRPKEVKVMLTKAEIEAEYLTNRGKLPSKAELDHWLKNSDFKAFSFAFKTELDASRKQATDTQANLDARTKELQDANKKLADLSKALIEAQNKPAEKVVEIVEKIVEVEKPVNEQEVVTNWFKRLWNNLFKKG